MWTGFVAAAQEEVPAADEVLLGRQYSDLPGSIAVAGLAVAAQLVTAKTFE